MSFERSAALESQPTTFRRQDDPEYSDDPEYKRFTEELSEKLFSLTRNINQLSKQVALLGTKRENERVRERVQNLVEETGNGFKEVGEGLKKVSAWQDMNAQQLLVQGKLNQQFRTSLGEFQNLQNQALQKQRAARTAAMEQEGQGGGDQEAAAQRSGQQLQQQEQQRLAPQSEVDFQQSLIIERETEIRQIEQSVGELNELFRDVASMVHEQGDQLNVISTHIYNTRDDTQGADQELRQASRYQRSARSKACCLLFILAIILIVVILAVVVG